MAEIDQLEGKLKKIYSRLSYLLMAIILAIVICPLLLADKAANLYYNSDGRAGDDLDFKILLFSAIFFTIFVFFLANIRALCDCQIKLVSLLKQNQTTSSTTASDQS